MLRVYTSQRSIPAQQVLIHLGIRTVLRIERGGAERFAWSRDVGATGGPDLISAAVQPTLIGEMQCSSLFQIL